MDVIPASTILRTPDQLLCSGDNTAPHETEKVGSREVRISEVNTEAGLERLSQQSIATSSNNSLNEKDNTWNALHNFDKFKQLEQQKLPPLPTPSFSFTYFRYQIYTVYHRIFSIVLTANLIALTIVLYYGTTTTILLRTAAINFMVCGFARLSIFNIIAYRLACSLSPSAPLVIRRTAAKVHHYGGFHSGSGVSAICWFIAYVAYATRDVVRGNAVNSLTTRSVLGLSYVVLTLLLVMLVAAYPVFRFLKHDVFEFTHRIISWTVIAVFWIAYLLLSHYLARSRNVEMGSIIIKDATFWCLIILTISLFSPWVTLRMVRVQPEQLSSHAIRLHFDYTRTKIAQGVSVSRSPFRDWHSFAAIPEKDGFSLVVSNAGDWTSDVIRNPPTRLWKRAIPSYGFGRTMPLFKGILLLATGSGIGPCLSLLNEGNHPPIHVLWQTRNPLRTYGARILEEVTQLDPHPLVIDTDKHGRQDMLALAWAMYHEYNVEAVFVVSNPKVTYEIVYGLEARGIPAYGAIFDS